MPDQAYTLVGFSGSKPGLIYIMNPWSQLRFGVNANNAIKEASDWELCVGEKNVTTAVVV